MALKSKAKKSPVPQDDSGLPPLPKAITDRYKVIEYLADDDTVATNGQPIEQGTKLWLLKREDDVYWLWVYEHKLSLLRLLRRLAQNQDMFDHEQNWRDCPEATQVSRILPEDIRIYE